MTKEKDFGSEYGTRKIFNFFVEQFQLLKQLFEIEFNNNKINKLKPLLMSIHKTCEAISLLSNYNLINECFI